MTKQEAEKLIARVKELTAENFAFQSQIMTAVQRMNHNSLELAGIAEMELYVKVFAANNAEQVEEVVA